MDTPTSPSRFTAALGQRYATQHLLSGKVKARGIGIEFPPVPRNPGTGAPMPIFSTLAEEHPWDIGEQALSTYLMARDLGKPWKAIPVFPSRFFPHSGLWINRASNIAAPSDLVDRRVACNSFGTNYSVWCRGALTHQYDVPIERMTWVESVGEHLRDYRPPKRFPVERMAVEREAALVLIDGSVDAATLPGPGGRSDPERVKPLFEDPYQEAAAYVEANGFIPINTVITLKPDAVERSSSMARDLFDTLVEARAVYEADVNAGNEDVHMGLSLRRLKECTGLGLPDYGFAANRRAVQHMITYCYEQGIIRRLMEPEDLFLLTDT